MRDPATQERDTKSGREWLAPRVERSRRGAPRPSKQGPPSGGGASGEETSCQEQPEQDQV